MLRLQATGIEKAFGDRSILRGASLSVSDGERVGLVGINGSGKSTLVKVLGGRLDPDHGSVEVQGRLGLLDQDPALPGETVGEALDQALDWHRRLLDSYQAALAEGRIRDSAAIQDQIEQHGWDLSHLTEATAERLGVVARDTPLARLSGGERRRLALARALLGKPDVLLLDEPTNHLDADTIEWLQGTLSGWRGALVIVTHDRYLLEAVATRIVEIEDGESVAYEGSYADYLITRAERRELQERQEDKRLAMIAHEAAWASRSPAARSTKQKARLQRLEALQAERPLLKDRDFGFDLSTGFRRGGALLELHGVGHAFDERRLFQGVDLVVRPGDRLGIVGPNGAGKSTLLRIVAQQLEPQRGELVKAPRLQPAVLDQERSGLDPSATVFEAAGNGNDHVRLGDRHVHVASFLERFAFGRTMFDQRVHTLSGGEQARLLLARLLLEGANLLLLDEPTNDLDLMTLRILEEALLSYDGAVLVVTHDRAFLDRVCTGVLAFEADGRVTEYADRLQARRAREAWEAEARAEEQAREEARRVQEQARRAASREARPTGDRKLSYKERQELEALPRRIEELEAELEALGERMADPALYKGPAAELEAVTRRSGALPAEIEAAYARWEALEARSELR